MRPAVRPIDIGEEDDLEEEDDPDDPRRARPNAGDERTPRNRNLGRFGDDDPEGRTSASPTPRPSRSAPASPSPSAAGA